MFLQQLSDLLIYSVVTCTHFPLIKTQYIFNGFNFEWASLVAQMVKNPPAMRDTWVPSLWQKVKLKVVQSFLTLCDSSSDHGILQARILEWVAIPISRESSWPRDWTQVSFLCRRILYHLSHQKTKKNFKASWNKTHVMGY